MTTLIEAREASAQLQKLQNAAALLPTLEANENKQQSLNRLESLRQDTQAHIADLYEQYNASYTVYMSKLNALLETVKDTARAFKLFVSLRREITITAKRYVNSYVQHNLQYEGLNRYQIDLIDMQGTNDILSGINLERPLSPVRNNPQVDTLIRLFEYFA